MSLQSQHIVILGGTSGIGLATAQAAAADGARVTVASRRQASVDKALADLPESAAGHAVDLGDPAAVQAFFDDIDQIDHLAYTAGEALVMSPLAELDLADARKFFEVRYFGALKAVQAARPHLRPGGSVTLTTGLAGRRPSPGMSVVSSLCGAMESLTKALALELAPDLRVNIVCPGLVRSPLWDPMSDEVRERLYADIKASTPLQRIGEVDDVARAFTYLMTQEFATGTVLLVEGGAELA